MKTALSIRKRQVVILFIILGLVIFVSPPHSRIVHASTATFSPAADNWLDQDRANYNHGDTSDLDVQSRSSSRNLRAILKFDMTGIPDGATVTSAQLSLYCYDKLGDWPGASRTYYAYRITQTAWTESGSTWNKYDGTNSWHSLGGDYMTTDGASATAPSAAGWKSWTVTAQVQYAVNNVGKVAHFLIRDGAEDDSTQYGAQFYSKEYGTPADRPKLVVTYSVIDRIVFTTSAQVLTAGTPSGVMTIQTQDASGAVNVPSDITISLTSTSGTGKFSLSTSPWSDIPSVTITTGSSSANFYYKDTTKGTPTITAAESPSKGWTDATQQDTVNPGALDHFGMTGYPSSVTAGQSFGSSNVVVTAYDAYNNVKTDYTGQVWFTSSDSQADLPYTSSSKHTFVLEDSGVHTFAGTGFTLKTTPSQTITVTDGTKSAASSSITVDAAALDHVLVTPDPGTVSAGGTQHFTAIGYDAYGNHISSLSFTWSTTVPGGSIGSDGILTAGGTLGTFPDGVIASSGGVSGSADVVVISASASRLGITSGPASVVAGSWATYTVQLQDQFGNPVNAGAGGVKVDLTAVPSGQNSKFSDTPRGSVVTFVTIPQGSNSVDFYYYEERADTYTILVASTGLPGDSRNLLVNVGDLDHVLIWPNTDTITAGSSETYSLKAYDAFNNLIADVSTSPGTSYSISFGAGGSWSPVNVYTSEKAGTWTVTGTYSAKSDTATLTVNTAPLDHFDFDPISSPETAGSAFAITITAKDQHENIVTSYTGSNTLSDSTGTISPTFTGAFSAGVWTGSVTITKAQTGVTITTIGDSKTGASGNFNVNPTSSSVQSATGTGLVVFSPDAGVIEGLTAVSESTLPSAGKPSLTFPHGFFMFRITGLGVGQTVTVTVTLPSDLPSTASYWKYHASEGGWIQIPMGSNDGDNVITITLVDGGLGDDDGIANEVIVDQGGPGTSTPAAPVGGVLMAVNKLAVLVPYLALVGLIAAASSLYALRRRCRS